MGKPWRELVRVTAVYYKAGEYPWPDFMDAEQMIAEHRGDDWEDDPDEWWADNDLWWFPGVGEERKEPDYAYQRTREIPDLDESYRLLTDAVQFVEIATAGPNGTHEFYGPGGLIRHEFDGNGIRDTLIGCADDIKALCDLVRGDKADRWVDAVIVFECDAGKDPDTWMGPGDYWSDWQPIGLLELGKAPIIALEESRP